MGLAIQLLGTPGVELDGVAQPPPRGRKAWGLLAYLVLGHAPVSRAHLASLLFGDAEDPLASLRWNLSQVRRLVGPTRLTGGDPVALRLDESVELDVRTVVSGTWRQAAAVPALGQDLLSGMSFPTCPSFDVWLESERRHLRGATESVLHEGALSALAQGQAALAADLAAGLVGLNPYDEDFQSLLVRALAASGDGVAAARQAAACRVLFRRELGVEPGPALAAAAATVTATPTAPARGGAAAVAALVEAGNAAIGAGAVAPGLHCLRQAVADARSVSDAGLEARALAGLGTALVHSVRGRDEEGATALHQAVSVAGRAFPAVAAAASRELGYVEFLRGRYDRVEGWLVRAEAAAGEDQGLRASIATVRGSTLSDIGSYEAALGALCVACAGAAGDRDAAYAWSMVGRVHLLRGDLGAAIESLDRSVDLTTRAGWTAFRPWPESLRGHVDLERGLLDEAQERLDHAFALGCHIGDPCWEGIAARGLGLVHAARGDVAGAVATLRDARARCTRLPDGYLWLDVWILDALAAVSVAHRLDGAAADVDELDRLAGRSGMREQVVRAQMHRAALGSADALQAALGLAVDVDNPALRALLAELGNANATGGLGRPPVGPRRESA